MNLPKKLLALFLIFLLGTGIGYVSNHSLSENARFEDFTEELFRSEVSGSTLTLHYSLAYPDKHKITRTEPSLGTLDSSPEKEIQLCQDYEKKLKNFSYSRLSQENQLTLDMLLLYFHTRASLGNNYLLEEVLGPSLGIQAQLPILLAEYAFYSESDISDYLKLLGTVRPYFQSILDFEKKKSQAGCFMSDTTLDRVLKQCNDFIQNPDSNYMQEIFEQKLKSWGRLEQSEQEKLFACHQKLLKEEVIPAYQELTDGLQKLRGTGKSSRGLTYFPGGKEYYLYLLQSQTGSYVSVSQLQKRLTTQLLSDSMEMRTLLKHNPSLLTCVSSISDLPKLSPEEMLKKLSSLMEKDFPSLPDTSWEIRSVHDSMKNFLSPAFYLTPPIDTQSPNIIYINQSPSTGNLELFGTLAHEGFPGHLYQTVSFARSKPSDIRYLITSSGYVEGWATYVESYAYSYAASLINVENASDATRLAWLNRSASLCIYSLIDVGIHYQGWTQEQTAAFLKSFGITSASTVSEIYQYIVETPGNYLKYYWGYLNFLDLKTACQKKEAEDFNLREFHRRILEIGPVPFPVLEKYLL